MTDTRLNRVLRACPYRCVPIGVNQAPTLTWADCGLCGGAILKRFGTDESPFLDPRARALLAQQENAPQSRAFDKLAWQVSVLADGHSYHRRCLVEYYRALPEASRFNRPPIGNGRPPSAEDIYDIIY